MPVRGDVRARAMRRAGEPTVRLRMKGISLIDVSQAAVDSSLDDQVNSL